MSSCMLNWRLESWPEITNSEAVRGTLLRQVSRVQRGSGCVKVDACSLFPFQCSHDVEWSLSWAEIVAPLITHSTWTVFVDTLTDQTLPRCRAGPAISLCWLVSPRWQSDVILISIFHWSQCSACIHITSCTCISSDQPLYIHLRHLVICGRAGCGCGSGLWVRVRVIDRGRHKGQG